MYNLKFQNSETTPKPIGNVIILCLLNCVKYFQIKNKHFLNRAASAKEIAKADFALACDQSLHANFNHRRYKTMQQNVHEMLHDN